MLLVPAAPQFVETVIAVPARLRVAGEPAAVHPDTAVLHGDDPLGGVGQQFPVVADQQDRLPGLGELLFEPELARHVEVVVRLVEQQGLGRAAQQGLQHQPLLLAAGQRAHRPRAAPVEADAERGDAAGVPEHLRLVAARVTPVGQGRGVPQLRALVVPLRHGPLGGAEPGSGLADPRGGHGHQQVPDGGALPAQPSDELAHDPEPAAGGHRAGLRGQVAGDEPDQRGLAGAVRARPARRSCPRRPGKRRRRAAAARREAHD